MLHTPYWSDEVFVIKKKLKKLCLGHMLLMILTEKKLWELLTKKNRKKQIKTSLKLKKLITMKNNKLYVKRK